MNELEYLKTQLKKRSMLDDAVRVLQFDQSTICPKGGMDDKNEIIAYLTEQSFAIMHEPKVMECIEALYADLDSLGEYDKALVRQMKRTLMLSKNLTSDDAYRISLNETQAFVDWSHAKENDDYAYFKPSLSAVIDGCKLKAEKRELLEHEKDILKDNYDRLLDLFDRGMTQADIDPLFDECKVRLGSLLDRIIKSKKQIRTDFMSREVSIEKQREITMYLMNLQGFDFDRGVFSTSEHGYTERLSKNDIRITTHFYTDCFLSSIYTVLHETGHALFDQRQPAVNSEYYLYEGKTLGMHESVSRFYENILGRSEKFVHMIYPGLKKIIPDILSDVTERELYEAVNIVKPSLIRTEADEVTYGFHIIIRYELERDIFAGKLSIDDLPKAWNDKYEQYLCIRPENDRDGVLQDIHWASDFGYFPVYLLGNLYNGMYFNRMKKELDIDSILSSGSIEPINKWMSDNVFAKADILEPKEWIKDITGRSICADDFLTYLEEKYKDIYEL